MGSNPPGRAKKPQDAIRRPVAFSAPGRMRPPESCESHTERQQDTEKKKEKKECCSHRNFGRFFPEGKLPEESPGAGQAVPAALARGQAVPAAKPRASFTER